jgi:hypothetical protein
VVYDFALDDPTCFMLNPLEVLKLFPEHDYTLNGVFESRTRRDKNRNYESRSNA